MFGKVKQEKVKKVTLVDLESQQNKAKLDLTKSKNEKALGPKTQAILKFARYFIWGAIILILAVGALQMIRSKQPRIIKNVVEYNFAPSESETAKAFAVAFTKEFLSYQVEKPDDYNRRISPFVVTSVLSGARVEQSKGSSKVVDAIAWKVDKLNKDHSNIIVRANVETTNAVDQQQELLPTGETVTRPKLEKKVVYVLIPIGHYDGGYIVEDYPTFVAAPDRPANASIETFNGNESVLEDEKEMIKEVLNNFFITYTTGNPGQISYYMEGNKKIKGYEGNYVFNGIMNIQAYKTNEKNKVMAVVQVGMKDAGLDTLFTQRYVFELVKKSESGSETRWYIIKFDPRGNIFKQDKGGEVNE